MPRPLLIARATLLRALLRALLLGHGLQLAPRGGRAAQAARQGAEGPAPSSPKSHLPLATGADAPCAAAVQPGGCRPPEPAKLARGGRRGAGREGAPRAQPRDGLLVAPAALEEGLDGALRGADLVPELPLALLRVLRPGAAHLRSRGGLLRGRRGLGGRVGVARLALRGGGAPLQLAAGGLEVGRPPPRLRLLLPQLTADLRYLLSVLRADPLELCSVVLAHRSNLLAPRGLAGSKLLAPDLLALCDVLGCL
mmetsp:Transcript_94384/g.290946  ORF Transcript_94384/g.290946 Transcript_94384/m.290946 type:complete len:253 (-) Transcript_94384:333-1091(-)